MMLYIPESTLFLLAIIGGSIGSIAGMYTFCLLYTSHLLVLGCTPEEAPDEAEYVTMTFEKGVPKSVNGVEMKVSDIIRTLNKLGAKHGIGIVDIVENRVVGMKSRGVYETPGGTILMEAHQQLEGRWRP